MNEYVESKVGLPGAALMVIGGLTVASSLVFILFILGSQVLHWTAGGAALKNLVLPIGQSVGLMVMVVMGAVIAYGGNCLRNGQNAPAVYAASIMAMIPCCSGACCCLGIPIGIWAIVTMQDEQVAAAFAEA